MTMMFVLWITIHSGPMTGETYGIPYNTEAACKKAMRPVGDSLDYDWSMECVSLPVDMAEMEP